VALNQYTIGIDVGGTFTDVVAVDENGTVTLTKAASTPADPSIGLLDGLALLAKELRLDLKTLLARTDRVVHGTTVATNALLERKGAKVGILTTRGHRDVLAMREGLKHDRYNLRLAPPAPLVPRHLTLGIEERIRSDGTVQTPLNAASVREAALQLKNDGVEALAVCYLHAYCNPGHEQATKELLRELLPEAYLSISSEVLPQIKEYERICTTVVNAYVGPALGGYLHRLEQRLREAGLKNSVVIMQSHGGVASLADSIRVAAGSVLSGPAGGISGGVRCGELLGLGSLITFDMGGTSTDIALIDKGEPQLTSDQTIAGMRIALPTIDIHTLGAGGGSMARVDAGGILHVGPQSAGAYPGPACYGRGGMTATVTDANLALGYLDPGNFLGGRAKLDTAAAARAVSEIARKLGGITVEAADGICRVVNTNMAEGISVVSVRRGVDPRRFALLSFGGAAGLHTTAVARMLEIKRVIVPRVASVLSAWGMLAGNLRWEYVRTCMTAADDRAANTLKDAFEAMEREGINRVAQGHSGGIALRRSVDMRLGEQIYEISVPMDGLLLDDPQLMAKLRERFHQRHEELYGYSSPQREPLIVNARLAITANLPSLPREPVLRKTGNAAPKSERRTYLSGWVQTPVYDFDRLPPGAAIAGPAIFESATTTVLVRAGETATVTPHGWLDITIGSA
jgi:N-methylhydantoinase A